jgi:hypothetical protein
VVLDVFAHESFCLDAELVEPITGDGDPTNDHGLLR